MTPQLLGRSSAWLQAAGGSQAEPKAFLNGYSAVTTLAAAAAHRCCTRRVSLNQMGCHVSRSMRSTICTN